jgi:hypothetical protein
MANQAAAKLTSVFRRIALLGAASVVASLPAHAAAPAKLKVIDLAPLRVAGTSFRARESVTVFLTQPERAKRRAQARRNGSFVVAFSSVTVDRCNSGVLVRAVGAGGSVAVLKLAPRLCPPSG